MPPASTAPGAGSRPTDLSSASQVLQFLPGVGPKRADLLAKLGLKTLADLLRHFPRRYEDRRTLTPIVKALPGETQVLYGEVESIRSRLLRRGQTLIEAQLVDRIDGAMASGIRPGRIELVWFNQPHLLDWIRVGVRLYVHGQVRLRTDKLQIAAPEFEIETEDDENDGPSPHIQRIVPVYPLTRGLQQRFVRGLIHRVLREFKSVEGPYDHFFPGGLDEAEALRRLHFPATWQDLHEAKERFIFEEYFIFASHLAFRRAAFCKQGVKSQTPFQVTDDLDRKIRSIFPFQLTQEQDQAIEAMTRDLRSGSPMYRLLQGDVGTGKTAVALYAMFVAVRNGYQAALLAPTEVLAEQHKRVISRLLSRYPVRVELLTGSVRGAARREILEAFANGKAHIAVGTHALIQDAVMFERLGLAVIDEQHRFGVLERMKIRKKGESPHVLVMTATPIPRSLCLTCYGDLDLSILRARPMGRKPVKTFLVPPRKRAGAMEFIRQELRAGRQAYFVYPLIEESEALSLPAAVKSQEVLESEVFPEFQVGLVHGQLKPEEKEAELDRFRRGECQVLVATVVVEVGIDVPNATVVFIEDATRFGLAQLHQLRGRVGRGAHAGYCLVGWNSAKKDVEARLKVFASTDDGFKISEEDLKLRGPGDYLGLRQSGRPHFLLGNPLEDLEPFLRVKVLAEEFWGKPENNAYRQKWAGMLELGDVGREFLGLD